MAYNSCMFSKKILILGTYQQTIAVIRSLGRAGFQLVVGCSHGHGRVFTQYSRYTTETWLHPDMEDNEPDFIEALAAFLNERPDVGFVFPVWELQVTSLMHHLDRLPRDRVLVMAEPDVVKACLDKFHLGKLAAVFGIPHTPPLRVTSHAELLTAAQSTGYPCVVKNNDSSASVSGKKALIAESPAELLKWIPSWPERNGSLIVQRFARGFRHNCHFIADEGRLLAYFEQRVLRTDRTDGTGSGVDTASCSPTEMLREYSAVLIRELNYSGAGCVQFLVDDHDGGVNLLELNPRLDATCALPLHCGYDFPRMALLYAAYRHGVLSDPCCHDSPYPAGKRGVGLYTDLNGLLRDVQAGDTNWRQSLIRLCRAAKLPFRGGKDYIWSWTDPLPGIFLFIQLSARALKWVARGRAGAGGVIAYEMAADPADSDPAAASLFGFFDQALFFLA